MDIKSAGPRDDYAHTVMSHNQVSGDGIWETETDNVKNTVLQACGARRSHDFHASLPPLVVLSDGTIAPMITIAVKPVYRMLEPRIASARNGGQPLSRIDIISIPNGLLLTQKPNYLKSYPSLLFPGKDDKGKNPLKLRARVSCEVLRHIDCWRVQSIPVPYP
ncbi:MAG: Type-2 restriction enzyme BglI [Desulfovibrio sp.]